MENYYIKNDNNMVENPCLTPSEGKKRVRRGEEEAKKRLRRGEEERKHRMAWRMLRVAAVLGMMMTWMMPAVAQTPDYSGTYYIGTNGYNPNATTSNYYLCPTEGWIYYKPTNNWDTDGNAYPNPFLTTYKCKTDAYHSGDPSDAVWIIEKHPTENYYYIKHKSDGKYMVSNGQISGTTNANRIRVHIETVEQANLDDKALFSITPYTQTISNVVYSYLVISPKAQSGWNGDKKWYTVNNGNKDYLVGNGSNGGPAGYTETGGVIGLYTQSDINAQFYLEDFPTISYNSSNLIEITTLQLGATIIYTTDGSEPSTTNPNAITVIGTEGNTTTTTFDPDDDVTTIKAIAIWGDNKVTSVATFQPIVLLGSTHPRLIQSQNNAWNTTDFHFYMIPGDDADNVTKVNTTSLFRPSMEWYFLNAGMEAGVQYYYIVNNASSENLCYEATNGVHMETNGDNANKFKFSIVEYSTTGTYNFIPYGLTTGNRFVNKWSGNGSANHLILNNSNSDANSRWKIVRTTDIDKVAPFTASDPSNHSYPYYTIKTVDNSNNAYYLALGTTNVQTLTSTNASALWYFEEAEASTTSDWLTYYNIRNAVTGDYLYFDKDAYDNNHNASCFKTSSEVDPAADSCMFTWAKTASGTVNYYIVPKLMKDASQNNIGTLYRNNNTNIRLELTRTTGTRVWTFGSSTFTFNPPTISYDSDRGGYVITSDETGAEYYYTTDGTVPVPIDPTTHFTNAIQVANWPDQSVTAFTFKAIAAKNGDGSDSSSVVSRTVYRVSTPVITPQTDGTVTITCDTVGARIYYAMGDSQPATVPIDEEHRYNGPIEGAGGKYITAIAVKDGLINSYLEQSGQIILTCATPVIRKTTATTFTITCSFPSSGVSIRYTVDGTEPNTTTGTLYEGEVTFDPDDLPFTVKAIAYATNYNPSAVAIQELTVDLTQDPNDGYYIIASDDDFGTFVSMVNENTINAGANYKIIDDINASNAGVIDQNPFTGELKSIAKADGTFPVISGLTHAIFNTVNGGMVHDIMLKSISVSGSGNVGAICNEAKGYTRIYNCGILPTTANFPNGSHSTVTSTSTDGCAGGIVGLLDDDSRVVNCFSYANVSSLGYAAGIVGKNTFASDASVTDGKYANLRTMVVNCMFYGDITAGSPVWPVYGGTKITNAGATAINNYNYYSDSCHFPTPLAATNNYNCSWPAKYEYLTRYEFHRYLLNSNRELCGWWVGAPQAPSTMATADVQAVPKDASLMAKWVLDRAVAPFPILKAFGTYSSPVNIDADASWRESANKWEGKKLGTLSVTINPGDHAASGITSTTKNIVITDMDTIHGDYCYRKIQLPYYNDVFGNPDGTTWAEKYGGNYTAYVVTGWDITSVTGGTTGELVEHWETGYNFADRDCTDKDTHRTFAQGGYYYVPNGVSAITIKAHWGNAVYLGNGDNYYDRVDFDYLFTAANNTGSLIANNKTGTAFAPAGTRSSLGNGQTIRTDKIATVAGNLPNTGSVFDNALVLVGNHQYCTGGENVNPSRSFTIMSADFDFDNEPDYCLDWQLGQQVTRYSFCPIRFDFLPIIEIGLGLKKDGSTQYYSLGCYRPLGHFEVTETALIRFGQFEFSNKNRSLYAPIILNGGIFEQYVKGTKDNAYSYADDKINYIIIGGNVYIPTFSPGAHVNANAAYPTRHCAVNAIGGKFDYLFLTGNYNDGVTPNADNPHCYIDGGWFGQIAAAGKEGIGNAALSEPKGDVTFEINHARIMEFYGGSTLADKRVTGNIDVTIDSSMVTKYCGGPKFGNMYDGKTVTTKATGTIFKNYYGGGNGGTSYVQYDKTDGEQLVSTYSWTGNGTNDGHVNESHYKPNKYNSNNTYQANYDMELINVSTGTDQGYAVFRSYFHAAQFSATNTGTISNTLTGCKVLKNFYGAGNLGGVNGDVTSTLIDTEVDSLAFGAGFSATIPTVTIYDRNKSFPKIDVNTGIVTPQSGGSSHTYTWCYKNPETGVVVPEGVVIPAGVGTGNPGFINEGDGKEYYFTTVPLENLGSVSGNVTLTLKGTSKVGTEGHLQTGSVFGGGDQSKVNGSTTVKLQGNANVLGNVYGGGNNGEVGGDSEVKIQDE